jgi:transposase
VGKLPKCKSSTIVRFLAGPKIPLDTNSVEQARKNHYGSPSERGTRTAALFYSLIESAKLCGVEPRTYLREATLRAVRSPGAPSPWLGTSWSRS